MASTLIWRISEKKVYLPLCGEYRMRLNNENKYSVFCFVLSSAFTIFATAWRTTSILSRIWEKEKTLIWGVGNFSDDWVWEQGRQWP